MTKADLTQTATALFSEAAPDAAPLPLGPEEEKLLRRLRRIEGQVRGLQRMVEEGRDCHDILTQFAAVRSALDTAGEGLLEQYALGCRARPGEMVTPADVVRAVKLLRR